MANNNVYINGLGIVSPQNTMTVDGFLADPVSYPENQLKCPDPGYKDYIPADMIRRMGRIIKMGVTASKLCLKDAIQYLPAEGETPLVPQAIITGTGLGCVEDTEKFLTSMIRNNEEFLTPTCFIQSTHNTVAGQIALILKCHGYNFTYVHRGISFESALLDAVTQMKTGELDNVLVGGCDELTQHSFAITNRLGFWKRKPIDSLRLLDDTRRGSIAGEGAAFMFLDSRKNPGSYAEIKGVSAFQKPSSMDELRERLLDFLSAYHMTEKEIGFMLLGFSGNPSTDHYYADILNRFQGNTGSGYFKHLCGEYHTASSFALGLAALILKTGSVPDIVRLPRRPVQENLDNILIYNHFMGNNHAFTLLSKS